MGLISTQNPWAFAFGLLGNITSFVVFLAPLPTFYRVLKKRSTEGFQSVPYVVALFSATLWLYYATQKSNVFLLITVNSAGCVIETIYIAIYIAFAPKKARIVTLRLILLLNLGGFCSIILFTHFLVKGPSRITVLGWVCVGFAVSVFASPLSAVRMVIRTKSVEFMPFYLSFFLTMSAVMWFLYGMSLKELCIAMPNVLGVIFGFIQMVLYLMYRKNKPVKEDVKVPEHSIDIAKLSSDVPEAEPNASFNGLNGEKKDENVVKEGDHDERIAPTNESHAAK